MVINVYRWLPQTNQDIFVKNRQVLFDGLGRLSELAFKGSTSLNLHNIPYIYSLDGLDS